MSEVRVSDITLSDRLSTQLQLELRIKELTEKIQKIEAELEKFKSTIKIETCPTTGVSSISVEINGTVKSVKLNQTVLDQYLTSSFPVNALINDILDVVVTPYRDVIASEINNDIAAIVNNRLRQNKGSSL